MFLYDEIGTRGINLYLQDLRDAGVVVSSFHSTRGGGNRFQLNFRNHRNFLHEKVFLADDRVAGVGTANFDSCSFRLNFEVTALVVDDIFVAKVEQMFRDDFARSRVNQKLNQLSIRSATTSSNMTDKVRVYLAS